MYVYIESVVWKDYLKDAQLGNVDPSKITEDDDDDEDEDEDRIDPEQDEDEDLDV